MLIQFNSQSTLWGHCKIFIDASWTKTKTKKAVIDFTTGCLRKSRQHFPGPRDNNFALIYFEQKLNHICQNSFVNRFLMSPWFCIKFRCTWEIFSDQEAPGGNSKHTFLLARERFGSSAKSGKVWEKKQKHGPRSQYKHNHQWQEVLWDLRTLLQRVYYRLLCSKWVSTASVYTQASVIGLLFCFLLISFVVGCW